MPSECKVEDCSLVWGSLQLCIPCDTIVEGGVCCVLSSARILLQTDYMICVPLCVANAI